MIRVLVDAELILSAFQENKHTKDAEKLLTVIMPFEGIELYITELCLDKIRPNNEYIASVLKEKFRVLPYDNCFIEEQRFKSIEHTGDFECAVEIACATQMKNLDAIVTFNPQNFDGATLLVKSVEDLENTLSTGCLVKPQPNLSQVTNLSAAKLREAGLHGTDLHGADLHGVDLSSVNLYAANLYGANFCNADLSGANLCDADLSGADLRGADLSGADLRGADLRGANLGMAQVNYAKGLVIS